MSSEAVEDPLSLFKAAIEFIGTGVVISDNRIEGIPVIYANPRFVELSGYALTEIVGRNCRFMQGPDTDRNRVAEIGKALRSGSSFSGELINYRKDGSKFWNRLSISPIRDIKNRITHFVGFQEDVTDRVTAETGRQQAELELRVYADRLARSNEDLETFAYLASHDLQEPLRTITSFLTLLQRELKDRLDPRSKDFIEFAMGAAGRLRNMVRELLVYARIEGVAPTLEMVDTQEIVEHVLIQLRDTIQEAQAEVALDACPSIIANRMALMLTFQNLISNAVRYRGDSTPQIRIRAERRENEWLFSVKDNGVGIATEDAGRIFGLFHRSGAGKRVAEGTGIGLATCKKCAESLGGRIWVTSELAKGSEFFFTIPDQPL